MALHDMLAPAGSGMLCYYSPIRGISEGQNGETLPVSSTLVYIIPDLRSTMIYGKWVMIWTHGQGLERDKIGERQA